MKRFAAVFCSILLTALSVMSAVIPAKALGPNLINNASVESATGTTPTGWLTDGWGTNTRSFSYDNSGQDGAHSVTVNITKYTSGDAKWYFTPVTVKPSTSYTYTDYYKSTVPSEIDADISTTANKHTYKYVGQVAASATWKKASFTFTTPATASKVSIFHYIQSVGSLSTDNFTLAETNGTTPTPTPTPIPTPVPTPTAPTVSVATPAANTTVSGAQAITATAASTDTSTITGVQFKLDGTALGVADTTAPYSANWDTTTATNGVHTLTAIATASNGLSTTSAAVSVTVNNVAPVPIPTPTPTPTPIPTTNLFANPSFETANGATPANWSADSWGTNTRTFSYETTGHTGSRSAKVTVSAYTSGDAKWTPASVPVTAGTAYKYSDWYQANVDTEVDAMVTFANNTVGYYWLGTALTTPANTWQQFNAQFTMPANAKTATIFHTIFKVGSLQTDDVSFAPYSPAQFNRGIVSLTFDDAWRSIYTNGLPLLQKYNLVSTQYLLTGVTSYPDYMTTAMMQAFQAQGSEIASHTINHPHLPLLTTGQVDTELANSQTSLRQWFGSGVATNFATPYGEYNTSVLTEIKKYYRSHRGVESGFNSKDSFDIYDIKVQNITNTTTPADVQAWVNQAIATKTWLVLVYHEVDTAAADPTYAVTPANLDAELNLIKQSGVSVQTVSQALNEIQAQL